MAVYVDQLRYFRKWRYANFHDGCHMFAHTIEELHEFAESFGLMRSWFQDTKHPHYDLTSGKRRMAIEHGAIEITTREYLKKLKGAIE